MLLLVLAGLGAIGVFVGVSNFVSGVQRQVGPTVAGLRLAEEVQANEPIKPEVIRPARMPERWAPRTMLTSTETLAGIMPLVLLIIVLLWQMALVGTTFVLGEHAAREGARELSVDDDARTAAMADLPVGWRRSAAVATTDDRVHVALRVPALFPGVSSPWTITTSAGAIAEGGS